MEKFLSALFLLLILASCEHEPIIPEGFDPNSPSNGNGIEDKPCNANTVYFQQQILPLLQSSCAVPGCHDVTKDSTENVVLVSYASLMNSSEAWDDNDPLQTEFWDVIEDGEMPPASSGKSLTTEQKELIKKWLNQGAKNNNCESMACDTSNANITYSVHVSAIINTHCKGCHSGTSPQADVRLTDYNEVKNVANVQLNGQSLLFGVVNHIQGFKQMPYNQPKLNDCKTTTINKWIGAGMPQ